MSPRLGQAFDAKVGLKVETSFAFLSKKKSIMKQLSALFNSEGSMPTYLHFSITGNHISSTKWTTNSGQRTKDT